MNSDLAQKVLIVAGPTGVGKTRLSLEIARELNAEIVSADSRLLYRGMDVGTAKPSVQERALVPHHLIDVAQPDEPWSLATFGKAVVQSIRDVLSRGRLPILVGGTGQYIRSLVEGWSIPEIKPNDRLRKVLEEWSNTIGGLVLHHKLALLDPASAATIQPENIRRTIRALEVILSTGVPFSQQRLKGAPQFNYKLIGLRLPRETLYPLIDERIEQMFRDGFIIEVERLLTDGYSKDLPSMSAIGYCEVACYLLGEVSLEEAKVQMKRRTRQFIRRQANWFKPDDPLIDWYDSIPDPSREVTLSVKKWLKEG
jgi:tRNA dimethylallyltransferase